MLPKLQIVPWFNKKEWEKTYKNAYSSDAALLDQAYTQMCIWKARYPNLPLGVECTMGILQVRLCDHQTGGGSAPYKDRDLQLLYSTAVMRFLNHLSAMSSSKDTMYKMAESQNIPDWLINLRHQAAHGSSVPALYLLRQAADLISQWLKVNYWDIESDVMEDVQISGENEQEGPNKIKRMLRLWLLLKTNLWADNTTLDSIVYESERQEVEELVEEFAILNTGESEEKRLKPDETGVDFDENTTVKIKCLLEPLISKLIAPAKEKAFLKKIKYQENLIDCLVNYEGFCPHIELDSLSERDLLRLMTLLGQLWGEVISALQGARLLHLLLAALVSCAERRPGAHLWLRLIAHTLANDPPPLAGTSIVTCRLLAVSLPCEIDPQILLQRLSHCISTKKPQLDLKPPGAKEREVLQQWTRRVVHNPTALTNKYLRSLLRHFWDGGRPSEAVCDQLCSLARIYTTRVRPDRPVQDVRSLSALVDMNPAIGLEVNAEAGDGRPTSASASAPDPRSASFDCTSPWKLYDGDADWSSCALGLLPWQCEQTRFIATT